MPSKFSRYWASINIPSSISSEQHAKLKQMIRSAFHAGIHVEAKSNRVPELMDSIALRDDRIEELEKGFACITELHKQSLAMADELGKGKQAAEAQLEQVQKWLDDESAIVINPTSDDRIDELQSILENDGG